MHAYIHMRVCVDVYAYTCAGVHVCVYMHMRVRPCTRTCARVCMRMHVYAYAQMEGPGGDALACLEVSWARVRTHVHVHACARVYEWARMCTACSECYMHFGTGVLGTSAWEGMYVHRCVFTPTYTSVTHSLQVVYMCVYVYICVVQTCYWACLFQILRKWYNISEFDNLRTLACK